MEKAKLWIQKRDKWFPGIGEEVGIHCKWVKREFSGDGSILKLHCGDAEQQNKFSKIHITVYLKRMNFMVYNV